MDTFTYSIIFHLLLTPCLCWYILSSVSKRRCAPASIGLPISCRRLESLACRSFAAACRLRAAAISSTFLSSSFLSNSTISLASLSMLKASSTSAVYLKWNLGNRMWKWVSLLVHTPYMSLFSCSTFMLSSTQWCSTKYSNWYKTVGFSGDYNHSKFEPPGFLNAWRQASSVWCVCECIDHFSWIQNHQSKNGTSIFKLNCFNKASNLRHIGCARKLVLLSADFMTFTNFKAFKRWNWLKQIVLITVAGMKAYG